MTQTITRLFDNYSDAEKGVEEIRRLGNHDSDVSLVAGNEKGEHSHRARDGKPDTAGEEAAEDAGKGAGIGAIAGGAGGLLAGLGMLAIPGLGPVVAAGWLAATAVGGWRRGRRRRSRGPCGRLTHAKVKEEDAHVYAEGVRRGGTLVSAKVPDEQASIVEATLDGMNGGRAGLLGRRYREDGWGPSTSRRTTLDSTTNGRPRRLSSAPLRPRTKLQRGSRGATLGPVSRPQSRVNPEPGRCYSWPV